MFVIQLNTYTRLWCEVQRNIHDILYGKASLLGKQLFHEDQQ